VVAKIEKPFFSDALSDLVRETLETGHRFQPAVAEQKLVQEIQLPETPPVAATREPPPPPSKEAAKTPSPIPAPTVLTPAAPTPPAPPAAAPPKSAAAPPSLKPAEPHIERHAPVAPATIRVAPTDGNAAVLGMFLEVLSMQLTSQLQMGAIRARPSSLTASLRLQSSATRTALGSEIGFQLGQAKLNGDGRISTLRVIPSAKPFQPAPTRTAFEIGGVALIPNETRARVQLTPAGTTPMTMELFAQLELSAVELSPTFQVAQLILNWNSSEVRVTLNPKAPEQSAAKFDLRVLKLDDAGRISELLLNPIR
jgi:hypothetical protein